MVTKKNGLLAAGCILLMGICAFGVLRMNQVNSETDNNNKSDHVLQDSNESTGKLYDYEQNEDGTWSANGATYNNKVILTGTMPNAAKESTYVVLTNDTGITFEDVTTSIFTSDSNKQLDKKVACVVEMN